MIIIISLEALLYVGYCIEQDIVQQIRDRIAENDRKILMLKRRLYEITPVEEK